MQDEFEQTLNQMADKWPSNIVARRSIQLFTGGLYGTKYLANEDCKGTGPIGGFTVGGQKVYPVVSVIDWLKSKAANSWAERKSAEV
jgi:hypothetical protein